MKPETLSDCVVTINSVDDKLQLGVHNVKELEEFRDACGGIDTNTAGTATVLKYVFKGVLFLIRMLLAILSRHFLPCKGRSKFKIPVERLAKAGTASVTGNSDVTEAPTINGTSNVTDAPATSSEDAATDVIVFECGKCTVNSWKKWTRHYVTYVACYFGFQIALSIIISFVENCIGSSWVQATKDRVDALNPTDAFSVVDDFANRIDVYIKGQPEDVRFRVDPGIDIGKITAKLTKENEKLTKENEELKAQAAKQQQEYEKLTKQLEDLQNEHGKLTTVINALSARLARLESGAAPLSASQKENALPTPST